MMVSPATTIFPAAGPPMHCRFQASMALPGMMLMTFKPRPPPPCVTSKPSSVPGARRNEKEKTQPPLSKRMKGDAGTVGDLRPCGVSPTVALCGVRGEALRLAGPGVLERCGVAESRAVPARCGVATPPGVTGDRGGSSYSGLRTGVPGKLGACSGSTCGLLGAGCASPEAAGTGPGMPSFSEMRMVAAAAAASVSSQAGGSDPNDGGTNGKDCIEVSAAGGINMPLVSPTPKSGLLTPAAAAVCIGKGKFGTTGNPSSAPCPNAAKNSCEGIVAVLDSVEKLVGIIGNGHGETPGK
mmetsp:Transcript_40983/g.92195  ORF Transcript_40983/g.92195 Transcript_40983/m.92195 type:complete len:297 (+) Transcript_40983:337-1227(+)